MPTSPARHEAFASEIRRIYNAAQTSLLERIARRLARGIDDESWATRKLEEIRFVRADAERQIAALRAQDPAIRQAVESAYRAGAAEAVADLRQLGRANVRAGFSVTNQLLVEQFANQVVRNLDATHLRVLRFADDAYRSIIAETASQVLTGVETRIQVTQAALNRFADSGITGFVDSAGRNWDIASYAEMATRSATGQAAVQGHIDRLRENNHDLVIVSDSPEECELCRPWEGEILSLGGGSDEYASVDEARDEGLFHPNCTHTLGAWVPGLSREMDADDNPQGYEDKQTQRYHERQIRKWKDREAVAITDEARTKAHDKVLAWQAEQRRFIAETDRTRKYERESITRAR